MGRGTGVELPGVSKLVERATKSVAARPISRFAQRVRAQRRLANVRDESPSSDDRSVEAWPTFPMEGLNRFAVPGVSIEGSRLAVAKRALLRALMPYARDQIAFNHQAVHALAVVQNTLQRVRSGQVELKGWVKRLVAGAEERLSDKIVEFAEAVGEGHSELEGRIEAIERRFRTEPEPDLVDDARRQMEEALRGHGPPRPIDADYDLVDRYLTDMGGAMRGTEAAIRKRLDDAYSDVILGAKNVVNDATPWLDIGCGRGELIELVRALGLPSIGVESSKILAKSLRDRGLPIAFADGLAALRAHGDASLGAVSLIQVFEHIPTDRWLTWLMEFRRVLRPDGILLIETVNPLVFAGLRNYMMDPTHAWPVAPNTLEHAVSWAGFGDVEVRFLHPSELPPKPTLDDGESEDAQDVECKPTVDGDPFVRGAQDYAVIARRRGMP